jgi:hypothetical protein
MPQNAAFGLKVALERCAGQLRPLVPLLRVSKNLYGMVSHYLLRNTVYINSASAIDRLIIFETRRDLPNLNIYPLDLKIKSDEDEEAGEEEDEFPESKPFGVMIEYPRNPRLTLYHFNVDCEARDGRMRGRVKPLPRCMAFGWIYQRILWVEAKTSVTT